MELRQAIVEPGIAEHNSNISKKAFKNIQTLIYQIAGIHMTEAKKTLVVGRLSKRLRILQLPCFDSYYKFLMSNEAKDSGEVQIFTDLLTTNETYFFREQPHFDFLVDSILPQYKNNRSQPLNIWSAACSSGEEGYTMCILLAEYLGIGKDWSILGTDISSRILQDAKQGVYNQHRTRLVPKSLRYKYFLKGTGSQKDNVAIVPELRTHINFDFFNLVEDPLSRELFDVIFCRNVLIYFDTKTKQKVIERLSQKLKPSGFLMTGRSESLHALSHSLKSVKPSIYQKVER